METIDKKTRIYDICSFITLFILFFLLANIIFAQSPVVKVDLNMSGRPELECNDPNYLPWIPDNVVSISKTFNGVTFTFKKIGANGTALRATYYKAGVQTPNYARLGCDGMMVDGGAAGAQIELTISGLSTGTHSLMAFHNAIDDPATNSFSPLDITVDGKTVTTGLIMSKRALTFETTQSSYLSFTATAGKSVVIVYKAQTSGSATMKNVYINGFELNTPNVKNQAKNPDPFDGDYHMNGDNGSYNLTWSAGFGATKHRVYYSTNMADVANASASAFKGEQTGTSLAVSQLYSMDTYYWRVDEITASGEITKGNVWVFRPRQLAFPGAEGHGRHAIGGRGGKVVHVTNLSDSGPGSLRYAVEVEKGPRTIVFDVGGTITLQSRLVLSDPYVTIAGQTAPGKGIQIIKAPFGLTGNDVIGRFLRVRIGYGITYDGMGLTGANISIMDHCSISFAIDEQFSSRGGRNITLQNTFISEALNVADHDKKPVGTAHGYSGSVSGNIGSFHHNLLAHNDGRNFSLAGGLDGNNYLAGRVQIVNQVVYNWSGRTCDGGAMETDFINNFYKQGPAASSNVTWMLSIDHENIGLGSQRAFFSGNVWQKPDGTYKCNGTDNTCGRTETFTNGDYKKYECFVSQQFSPTYVTTQSAANAYKVVLSDVGANQPMLDNHDIRVLKETKNGTYTYKGSVSGKPGLPDRESDVGGHEVYNTVNRPSNWDSDKDGLPDFWETYYGSNKNSAQGDFSDANADPDRNGYTALEDYLNWMAAPHYFNTFGNTQEVDLAALFYGFNSPTYSVANVVGGAVTISGSKATLTPSGCGMASFVLKATESGFTMSRSVGVFTESNPAGSCVSSNLKAPLVAITTPTNNTTKQAPATIAITATASDTDGTISKVEFFNGTSLLGTKTVAPYTITWNNVLAGTYTITAKATDNTNLSTTSTPITVIVTPGPNTIIYNCATTDDWTSTANWTPAILPGEIDTAIIRTGEVKINQNFDGTVRIEPNGIFRLTANVTTPNLRLQGGTLKSFTSNPLFMLNSTVTVEHASTIWAGSLTTSVFQIDGVLQGTGNLTKSNIGILSLNVDATSYTGNWNITEGILHIANNKSIGQGTVEISTGASLNIATTNVNIDSLALNGTLILGNNLTTRVCTIAGTPLLAGVYTAADYPFYITGTGTLTVLECSTCDVTQTIYLSKGWNLFSTNIDAKTNSIENVFNGLNVGTIKNAHGFWESGQNAAFNSLQTITAGEGYLIYMNVAGTLTIFGTPCTDVLQYTPTGWQLIGCPYKTSTPFSTLFNTSNCQIIKNFDGFWIPEGTTNSIENFEPGKAYFVKP